jgi:hypothetical protein
MTTSMEKLERENREYVMKRVEHKTEEVAHRDKLDLDNPADRVKAYSRACAEDRDLYNLYRRVMSVPVRDVSPED